MTDDLEQRIINQERDILRLRAELAEAKTIIANLRRMHDTAQNHIGRLQAQIARMQTNLAEQVFGK